MPQNTITEGKLPFRVKLGYGLSGYTSFIAWSLFSYYGLYFFTDVVGMAAAFAGAIISIGTLWDAVTDPIVGGISDNIKWKRGRRRPLIAGVAVPFCFISVLLFTNWGFDETVSKIYFVVLILLYYTAQTILDISSSALGSEMTLDYDERTSLATWKNFFCMVVVVAVSPMLMLVSYFGGWFENSDYGWSAAVGLYMVIALVLIFILWRTTKGYEKNRGVGEGSNTFSLKDIPEILKNKSACIVILMFAIGVFANTMHLSIQVYYFTYYVGLTEAQIAKVNLVFGLVSILMAWVVDQMMRIMTKKAAWILALLLNSAALILMVGVAIPQGAPTYLIVILVVLMSVANAAVYQVPWAMIPDCVDVHELKTGKRTDGVFYGIVAFVQKAAGALGAALIGGLLTLVGYDSNAAVLSESALSGMKNIYGFLIGILFAAGAVIAVLYPLNKTRHEEVCKAIEDRKMGKETDLSAFQDL